MKLRILRFDGAYYPQVKIDFWSSWKFIDRDYELWNHRGTIHLVFAGEEDAIRIIQDFKNYCYTILNSLKNAPDMVVHSECLELSYEDTRRLKKYLKKL